MKINFQSGPNVIQPATSASGSSMSARARAIAMVQGQAAPVAVAQEQALVQNPTQVAPEELSVVTPQSSLETSQNTTSGDEPVSEQPVEAKPPAEKKAEDPLSSQYALLARKEKALRMKTQAQETASKEREALLAAREEALKAKEAEYQSNYIPKSKFKSDPLAVLAEEGVSYDEITNAILNPQAKQDPRILNEIDKLKAEVRAAREVQEKAQQAYEEQKRQDYKQAVNQIRMDAKRLVESDANFETIKETNAVNDVVDLIEKTFKEDGILLSVEEAAKEVEEFIVDKAIKIANINKIKSRLQAAAKPAAPKQEPKQTQPSTPKTLTNAVNAAKKLSSRERAIAAFKGELK